MRSLYPPIEPYDQHRLKVSEVHELHVMQAGNPEGVPVVFLHGGPGGGVSPGYARFFDPARWRVILFDQRGAGLSTPSIGLEDNTTWDLVGDIEKLRVSLGIDSWHVFGGSWGSTLALSYAAKHPERVRSMCLRGIFLVRQREITWLYQHGACEVYPDAWEHYLEPIPEEERGDLLAAYYKRLTGSDEEEILRCARAWSVWEGSTSKLHPRPEVLRRFEDPHFSRVFATIECHYFHHKGFMPWDGWLLDQVDVFRHIPCAVVQGRYDIVCPTRSAWDLHRAWPQAELRLVHAGHSSTDPAITHNLLELTDQFARTIG